MTVVDLSTHQTSILVSDIDQFYNELDNFDFKFMLFQDYYKGIVANLKRFNPQAQNKNFDLVMLQLVLKDDPFHPIKPVDVFLFNLKWNVRWSSSIYLFFLKRIKKEIS